MGNKPLIKDKPLTLEEATTLPLNELNKRGFAMLEPKIGKKGTEKEKIIIILKNFCFHNIENLEEIDRIIEDTEGNNSKKELLEDLIYETFPRFISIIKALKGDIKDKKDTLANYIYYDIKRLINKYFTGEDRKRLFEKINSEIHEFDQLI